MSLAGSGALLRSSFRLASANSDPHGIAADGSTSANGVPDTGIATIFVGDATGERIYGYSLGGALKGSWRAPNPIVPTDSRYTGRGTITSLSRCADWIGVLFERRELSADPNLGSHTYYAALRWMQWHPDRNVLEADARIDELSVLHSTNIRYTDVMAGSFPDSDADRSNLYIYRGGGHVFRYLFDNNSVTGPRIIPSSSTQVWQSYTTYFVNAAAHRIQGFARINHSAAWGAPVGRVRTPALAICETDRARLWDRPHSGNTANNAIAPAVDIPFSTYPASLAAETRGMEGDGGTTLRVLTPTHVRTLTVGG